MTTTLREHAPVDLVVGDTLALRFTIDDGAGGTKDLTGAQVRWALGLEGAVVLTEADADVDVVVEDAAGGVVTVAVADVATAKLVAGRAYRDELEVVDAAGTRVTVARGHVRTWAQLRV